nr:monooxygenase subunit [Pseudomonas sp.]
MFRRFRGVVSGSSRMEFLAAEGGDAARGPGVAQEQVGGLADHFVADGVPMGVVHLFEVVEIDHQQTEGLQAAFRTGQFGTDQAVELAAVEQAGEGIVSGEVFQLAVLFRQLLLLPLNASEALPENHRQQQSERQALSPLTWLDRARLRIGLAELHACFEGGQGGCIEAAASPGRIRNARPAKVQPSSRGVMFGVTHWSMQAIATAKASTAPIASLVSIPIAQDGGRPWRRRRASRPKLVNSNASTAWLSMMPWRQRTSSGLAGTLVQNTRIWIRLKGTANTASQRRRLRFSWLASGCSASLTAEAARSFCSDGRNTTDDPKWLMASIKHGVAAVVRLESSTGTGTAAGAKRMNWSGGGLISKDRIPSGGSPCVTVPPNRARSFRLLSSCRPTCSIGWPATAMHGCAPWPATPWRSTSICGACAPGCHGSPAFRHRLAPRRPVRCSARYTVPSRATSYPAPWCAAKASRPAAIRRWTKPTNTWALPMHCSGRSTSGIPSMAPACR